MDQNPRIWPFIAFFFNFFVAIFFFKAIFPSSEIWLIESRSEISVVRSVLIY